jgi:hypothetical protein
MEVDTDDTFKPRQVEQKTKEELDREEQRQDKLMEREERLKREEFERVERRL